MGRLHLTLPLACLSISLGTAGSTQDRPDLTRFRAFASPLIGTWSVRIRDIDEHGKVVWDDASQRRSFSFTIGDEFLREDALVHSPRLKRDVVTGMHLFSYDPRQNLLIQHGFWPGKAGPMFTAEVRLADDNRSAVGTITMPQEAGVRKERRLEIRWLNDREFSYRAYGRDKGGREFLNEELIYARSS